MWNYLYFVLYLDTLFKNDRNALEAYVYKQVSKQKHRLFNLYCYNICYSVLQLYSYPVFWFVDTGCSWPAQYQFFSTSQGKSTAQQWT